MRTKTLILSTLLGVAATPLFAQTNVYSVNAVGYVQLTFPANQFKMFSNPLNATNNSIGALFTSCPDGTLLYKYNGSGYTTATYASFLGGWDQPSITLNPGEGAFLQASATFTNTFVGQVMQGSLSNSVPAGISIRSSMVPQSSDVTTLGLKVNDGDLLYQYTGSGYNTFTYASFLGGWSPSAPVLAVGSQSF